MTFLCKPVVRWNLDDNDELKENEKKEPENGQSAYLGLGIAIGLGLGVAFGSVFDNIGVGIGTGVALGVAIGGALSSTKSHE